MLFSHDEILNLIFSSFNPRATGDPCSLQPKHRNFQPLSWEFESLSSSFSVIILSSSTSSHQTTSLYSLCFQKYSKVYTGIQLQRRCIVLLAQSIKVQIFNGEGITLKYMYIYIRSDQISHSVVSDSLRPHESQHARPPCPSPTPGVHSDSCPSSQ